MPELDELRLGILHFNLGKWYEAHEAWEEKWMAMGGSGRDFYKALIQVAVGLHHWENHNPRGGRKLVQRGRNLLLSFAPEHLGVALSDFIVELDCFCQPLENWDGKSEVPFPKPQPPRLKA